MAGENINWEKMKEDFANDAHIDVSINCCGVTETISVKKYLDLTTRGKFVAGVSAMMFNDIGNGEEFFPYMHDFAIKYHIVVYFTNIKLPENVDEMSAFFNATDVIEKITEAVPKQYLNGLIDEAEEMIRYKASALAKTHKYDELLDNLVDTVRILEDKLKETDGNELVEYIKGLFPAGEPGTVEPTGSDIKE